jgi:hypothetical protein
MVSSLDPGTIVIVRVSGCQVEPGALTVTSCLPRLSLTDSGVRPPTEAPSTETDAPAGNVDSFSTFWATAGAAEDRSAASSRAHFRGSVFMDDLSLFTVERTGSEVGGCR